MMRGKGLWISVALAGVLVAVAARWPWTLPEQALTGSAYALRPDDAKLVALGESVYRSHCAACHGDNLEGQPDWQRRRADGRMPAPPHDASGHTWHHPDEQLFGITKYGSERSSGIVGHAADMPAFTGVLSDEEIVAVLSWIKAQWPAPIRLQHNAINRRAQSRP